MFGRTLELRSMNDNYDPALAVENMKVLLDIQQESPDADTPDVRGNDSVFAILGNIGTPTMLETAPIATRDRVLFFAPFTGAQKYLRDGTNSPYVYNYRAGYYQETDAMVDYMATYRQPRIITSPPGDSYRRILAFTQRDSYGDAGYNGLVNSYNRLSPLPQPDSTQPEPVDPAPVLRPRRRARASSPRSPRRRALLTALLAEGAGTVSVAIVMVDTYQPGNKFIRGVLDWVNQDADARDAPRPRVHARVVRGQRRARRRAGQPARRPTSTSRDGQTRRRYADGVMVTQVVPYYGTQAAGVARVPRGHRSVRRRVVHLHVAGGLHRRAAVRASRCCSTDRRSTPSRCARRWTRACAISTSAWARCSGFRRPTTRPATPSGAASSRQTAPSGFPSCGTRASESSPN